VWARNGNNVDRPTRVPGQTSVAEVAAGGAYSLFVDTDGDLWGSGDINDQASTSNQLSPVKVFSEVDAVSAGAEHALVVGTPLGKVAGRLHTGLAG